MKISKLLIIFCLCLLIFIPIVNAETVLGTLGATTGGSFSYSMVKNNAMPVAIDHLIINTSQSAFGTNVLVHFDVFGHATYGVGLPISLANEPFSLTNSAGTITYAKGTFGYQRAYNSVGTEINGYQWFLFNEWTNVSTFTGNAAYTIHMNTSYTAITSTGSHYSNFPVGYGNIVLGTYAAGDVYSFEGDYIRNILVSTFAEYTAVRPLGIGITGVVTKLHLGITYPSRAYVFNGTSGVIITNNPIVNTIDLPFNLLDQPIIIGIQDPLGIWYNSSVLFAPVVPIPTPTPTPIPTTWIITNISIYVKTESGIPIQNAIIEMHTASSGQGFYGAGTDSNGKELFGLVSHYNGETFHLKIVKSGYYDYLSDFVIYNMASINITANMISLVQPTPTPAPYETWTLSANPLSINLGASSVLSLTCSNTSKISEEGMLIYYENKNIGIYSTFDIIGVFLKNTTGSIWGFKPNMSASYVYSAYNPNIFTVTPSSIGTYTYNVGIAKNNSESLGTATTNLFINDITPHTNLIMTLSAHDGATTSHLMNYTLILTEVIGGISHTYNVVYDIPINLQRGKVFTLTGQKIGYVDNTITFTVPLDQNIIYGDYGSFISVPLFPTGTISAGNTTLTVHVTDKETYYPIPNVQIVMTGFLTPKFTGTSGESVSFVLPQNTGYTVTANKDGYCSVSQIGNTSTQDYYYIDLYMKYGACFGVTPTHTIIPNTTTISVIPTTIYNNFTGTVTICNNLPVNASIIDHIKNQLACFGITDLIGQNLALSVLIILVIGSIAASKAGAIGFAIGGVLGAVISMVMGLIPFFIIVVLVICSIAILAIKIFFTPG